MDAALAGNAFSELPFARASLLPDFAGAAFAGSVFFTEEGAGADVLSRESALSVLSEEAEATTVSFDVSAVGSSLPVILETTRLMLKTSFVGSVSLSLSSFMRSVFPSAFVTSAAFGVSSSSALASTTTVLLMISLIFSFTLSGVPWSSFGTSPCISLSLKI